MNGAGGTSGTGAHHSAPGAPSRVLVVEDDAAVAELVALHLRRAGLSVEWAATSARAWDLLDTADAVVLDRILPDQSGDELLRRLRAHPERATVPVLMLTARATEMDRVTGLEAGADDYLVKPFSVAELVARIRALLRRVPARRRLDICGLQVDLDAARVLRDGSELSLTRREFDLFAFLLLHRGRVFSRSELLDRVWGEAFLGTERTVDQHVAQLRRAVGPDWIETVRGRGYRVVEPKNRG